jgi:hypothetical protein
LRASFTSSTEEEPEEPPPPPPVGISGKDLFLIASFVASNLACASCAAASAYHLSCFN